MGVSTNFVLHSISHSVPESGDVLHGLFQILASHGVQPDTAALGLGCFDCKSGELRPVEWAGGIGDVVSAATMSCGCELLMQWSVPAVSDSPRALALVAVGWPLVGGRLDVYEYGDRWVPECLNLLVDLESYDWSGLLASDRLAEVKIGQKGLWIERLATMIHTHCRSELTALSSGSSGEYRQFCLVSHALLDSLVTDVPSPESLFVETNSGVSVLREERLVERSISAPGSTSPVWARGTNGLHSLVCAAMTKVFPV